MTERVTVTSPRKRTVGVRLRRQPSGAWSVVGADAGRALIRAQARLALATCATVALVAGGLPLLFACAPGLSQIRLVGVRLPWLVLCVVVPLIWVTAARRHVRLAERAEREFAALARRD